MGFGSLLKGRDENNESVVAIVQKNLEVLGIEAGPIDGIYGSLTAEGIKEFKRQYMSGGNIIDGQTFAALSVEAMIKGLDNSKDESNSEPAKLGKFSLQAFIDIAMHDCEVGYNWNEGGVESSYYKRFIKPWVDNTRSYSKRYYPACAMGQHLWLKHAGLNLPYFYKGSTFALVGTFKKWGRNLGIYKDEHDGLEIPAGSIILFGSSHVGMVPKKVESFENDFVTCEVNRGRKVVYGKRTRSQINGIVDLSKIGNML